jgi:hypothetical protein
VSPLAQTFHSPRFGWCWQYIPPDGDAEAARRMNPATVTVACWAGSAEPGRWRRWSRCCAGTSRRGTSSWARWRGIPTPSPTAARQQRAPAGLHCRRMWNHAVNPLVAEHLAWDDFKVEAKAKNLGFDDLEHDAFRFGTLSG